jgi:hypothetical protein
LFPISIVILVSFIMVIQPLCPKHLKIMKIGDRIIKNYDYITYFSEVDIASLYNTMINELHLCLSAA